MKKSGFFRLFMRSLPEIWFCNLVIGLILWFPMATLNTAFVTLSTSGDFSITTANLKTLLSLRALEMFGCGFLLVLLLFVGEIFVPIYLCDTIQKEDKVSVLTIIKQSVRALPRFLTPAGFLILLYILIISPIIGMGVYLSLTKQFYIPHFITEVIEKNPTTAVLYEAAIIALFLIGLIHMFIFHGVLLDGDRPGAAMRRSRQYVVKHWKTILFSLFLMGIIIRVLFIVQEVIFNDLPHLYLDAIGTEMPRGYIFNAVDLDTITDEDMALLIYRFLCILQVYISQYAFNVYQAISSCALFMVLTRLYIRFRKEDEGCEDEPEQYEFKPRTSRNVAITLLAILIPVLLVGISAFTAVFFNEVFPERERVAIVAHRTGGHLASENSLEGIDEAASHHCYGSETDIQRTKDRHYIINHDDDFARLTGDPRKPAQMTLEEVKGLRIRDTTGSGNLLPVPTLEELLDRGKGKVTLFLELKGETADFDMADDVIKAVKEREMVDGVIIISLKYDVIDYIERTYPEVETGVLIFASMGDVTKLNCDMIIMEEEMSTPSTISAIHESGKRVGVWTVNTERAMRRFLDSEADAVITDDILLSEEVQKELDERTDYEMLEDRASDLWFY